MTPKFRIRKMDELGRDPNGVAIYPAGCWTLWQGDKFRGWNWKWESLQSFFMESVNLYGR